MYNFDTGKEKSFEKQFDCIISNKPDGIIFAPHFHECSIKKINILEGLNIPYIFIDTYLELESGLAFFGQNAFQGGFVAAKLMHYGLTHPGKVLILHLGRNKAITPHMRQREQGFLSYFKDSARQHELKVKTLVLDLSVPAEPDQSLLEYISSNHDIKGIFVTNSRAHKVASCIRKQCAEEGAADRI